MAAIDLTGKKFGRWTVIKADKDAKPRKWICRCECGTVRSVFERSLVSGKSVSCGCYQREASISSNTTHNMSRHRLYKIYMNMKSRCYNPKSEGFSEYGGRGIKICDEWLEAFDNFCDWSLENGYADCLTIDRIDNDGNYCPENCRWATVECQSNNRQNTIFFEFLGVKKSLKQWTQYMGWKYSKYYGRYYRGNETFRHDDVKQIEEKIRSE